MGKNQRATTDTPHTSWKGSQATAQSLGEFVDAVARVRDRWSKRSVVDPWFRGQRDARWPLMPGAYRTPNLDEDSWRSDFKLRAWPLFQQHGFLAQFPPETEFDWYSLMQHYELPTRLLDWSEGSLVALHFALTSVADDATAVVWLLNPYIYNKKTIGTDEIIHICDKAARVRLPPEFEPLVRCPKPVALQVRQLSPRIAAQRGLFTLHGTRAKAVEDFAPLAFERILIPSASKAKMRAELRLAGLSESSLFPELPALARELKEMWGEDPVEWLAKRPKRSVPKQRRPGLPKKGGRPRPKPRK